MHPGCPWTDPARMHCRSNAGGFAHGPEAAAGPRGAELSEGVS